ncbi:MAG: heavy-metal-associated domain-containing protein [Defluviitaleaceae bacterium]|nr:heavy-metal-associated domain-containing protein [Defluviitaleaceae bacterium]
MQTTVNIKGMDCGGCVDSVTKKLKALSGVTGVSVSLEKANAVIDHLETLSVNTINTAIEELGFDVA